MGLISERTRLLGRAISWWWAPSQEKLRGLAIEVKQARQAAAGPFDLLDEDIARLWPASAGLHDRRWHLLSHAGVQDNTNSMTKAHWRCALVMAWLDGAPDAASRAWGVNELMAWADLREVGEAGTGEEAEQVALRAAVACALSLDPPKAGPAGIMRPSQGAGKAWAQGLGLAMGRSEAAMSWGSGAVAGTGVQALLWAVLFDRREAVEAMLGAGGRLNEQINIPTELFKKAGEVANSWARRIGPSRDREKDKPMACCFAGTWNWRDFGIAHWVASTGAQRCLAWMLPRGIVLDESSTDGQTAASVCLQYLHPAMAAGILEHGGWLVLGKEKDKGKARGGLVKNCAIMEGREDLRDDYQRMLRAMLAAHANRPWEDEGLVRTLLGTLETAPAAGLVASLAKMVPGWHGWAVDGEPVMGRALLASREHPQAGVLRALAGPGPGMMEEDVKHMAWGMLVAAVEPSALDAWLAHANAADKRQLAGFVATSSVVVRETSRQQGQAEGKILAELVKEGETISEVALRSIDPVAGLGAVMQDPILGAAVRGNDDLVSRVWAQAMLCSDTGKHEALEAALEHLPAPAWGSSDCVPEWKDLLSRPRNDDLVRRTIISCPVGVRVDEAGNTPLHAAVCGGDADAVQWLVEAGADPAQANAEGVTPASAANQAMLEAIARGQSGNLHAHVASAPVGKGRAARF